MATVSDVLETVFKATGAAALGAVFVDLAGKAGLLAQQEVKATAGAAGLNNALKSLSGPLTGVLGGGAGALGGALGIGGAATGALAGAAAIGASLGSFADAQQNLFRTTILFQNLGSSLPISQLQELAASIQETTGFDDDLIISLGGVLARFGVAGKEIPDAARAIADASAATGQSIDELGLSFGRALLGNTRGLKTLGIEFTATGNRAADAAKLVDLFNEKFAGAGEGRRDTLAGTFDALQNSLANLFESIGRILAPVVIQFLNDTIQLIDLVTGALTDLADRFPQIFPSGADIAARLHIKGDPEQTRHLAEIAENTKAIPDKLIQAILGGPGTVANRAGNLRDARIAWGI